MLFASFPAPGCKKNEDCTKGKNGICAGTVVFGTECYYDECTTDADCKTGTLCNCDNNNIGGRTSCLDSDCRVDADCGSGGYCTPNAECGYVDSFHCHHPSDACFNDRDCTMQYQRCLFDRESGWSCRVPRCPG
jgi:Cys-rich repeat protein